MFEFPILRDLGYVILGAAVLLFLARPLRLPPILVYLSGGLLLGPAIGVLAVSESIELFSELGVALLLFVVGLELSVEKVRDVGRPALLGGTVQVVATLALAAALALALGFPRTEAVFIGLVVTFSSTVVVIKLLDRAGGLDAVYGRLSIGILLVQDVLVAVVLTLVSGLGAAAGAAGGGEIARGLAGAFLGIAVLGAGAAVAVRWILPRAVEWLSESTEALFIASLAWALVFILGAEAFHVSIELGAFVAGVALAQLPYNEELRRRIHPLVDFFLAVFFVALGAGMDLDAAGAYVGPALLLSAFVILGKPALIAWLMTRFGRSRRTSFLTGLTLGQVSEFAFVLLGMAVGAGLVDPGVLSLLGLIGLVTIGGSAALVPRGPAIYDALNRRGWLAFLRVGTADPVEPPRRSGHVVIVGMNTLGRRLVEELTARGESVLAIDTDPDKLAPLRTDTLFGSIDDPSVLEEAEIGRAKLVVSALQIEEVNRLLAYRCRRLGVPVSIHAFEPSLAHELLEIGVEHVMVSKHDGIRQMELELRRLGVIG